MTRYQKTERLERAYGKAKANHKRTSDTWAALRAQVVRNLKAELKAARRGA